MKHESLLEVSTTPEPAKKDHNSNVDLPPVSNTSGLYPWNHFPPVTRHRDRETELDVFRNENKSNMQKVVNKKNSALRKAEKPVKLNDLKKFAANFKLNSMIPDDLFPLLAKDPAKQSEIASRQLTIVNSRNRSAASRETEKDGLERVISESSTKIADKKKRTAEKDGKSVNISDLKRLATNSKLNSKIPDGLMPVVKRNAEQYNVDSRDTSAASVETEDEKMEREIAEMKAEMEAVELEEETRERAYAEKRRELLSKLNSARPETFVRPTPGLPAIAIKDAQGKAVAFALKSRQTPT